MYPITFDTDYAGGVRSRGLAALGIIFLRWLLLIPHLIVLVILYIVAAIAVWVGYIITLFTGKIPEGLFKFVAGTMWWWANVTMYNYANTDQYPPFALEAPGYPVQLAADYGDGKRGRLLALLGIIGLKWLLALPHLIIVAVLGYAAAIGGWVGYFIILFTGKLPEGLHDFLVGSHRWGVRTYGWVAGLTDEYPPFSLS